MPETYDSKKTKKYTQMLREIQKELPDFCGEFFRGIESVTSALTRFSYAVDLRTFFEFLVKEPDGLPAGSVREITLLDLEKVDTTKLEIYLEYLTLYIKEDKEISNHERAKARKLSALRTFFKYFYKKGKLKTNAPSLLDLPKLHQKSIIRLEPNEIADLLDTAEDGKGLTETQKKYNRLTRTRDVAILTLFLGTGIRISELVGIDMDDINFVTNEFLIVRKGGNQDTLSFGEETRKALLDYFLERETVMPEDGHENALFLSMQRKRITARSVENLVKKYASLAVPQKCISPHKLRSTYGTMLYRETGDIYLVADILGHKDVNTTKKHYAAISEDRRKIAAHVIKLREDDQ
jgi:site-specific recombinase XerD